MRRATFNSPAAAGLSAGVRLVAPAILPEGEVDVWRATLDDVPDDEVAFFTTILSADEEDRAEEFYLERDRRRFVACRGILRLLVSDYTGQPAGDVVLRYGVHGKPELGGHDAGRLHFNLAHAESLALFAFTRSGPVGIDVERIRELPDWESIVRTCFSEQDRARVRAAAPGARLGEFFRAWTRQEARLKALGVGIGGRDPIDPAQPAEPYTDGYNPAFHGVGPRALSLYPLHLGDGYAAALAADASVRWATFLGWNTARPSGGGRAACQRRRMPLGLMAKAGIRFL